MADPAIPTDRPGDLAGEPRAFSLHRSGMNRGAMIGAGLLIVLAAGGAYYYYGWQQRPAAAPPAESPAVTIASPAAALPAPAESSIQHPVEPATGASTSALTLDQSDPVIAKAWADLLGAKAAATMLQRGDFVRRLVATVDGLGRSHAAPRLWPNQPTLGRFTVQVDGGTRTIGAANAARYTVFIALAESIDTARAAAAYKQHYPLFQAAYRELGYPHGYFNDRLVEVIDQLLATPEPAAPLALRLIEVKGEVASTQPWTRYEFTDPQLEALPAGSKMLLRMGNDNARRLKAQLQAFRALIATPPPAAPAR